MLIIVVNFFLIFHLISIIHCLNCFNKQIFTINVSILVGFPISFSPLQNNFTLPLQCTQSLQTKIIIFAHTDDACILISRYLWAQAGICSWEGQVSGLEPCNSICTSGKWLQHCTGKTWCMVGMRSISLPWSTFLFQWKLQEFLPPKTVWFWYCPTC